MAVIKNTNSDQQPEEPKVAHLLQNHVNISQYADLKGVARKSVYRKIKNGEIVMDKIGKVEPFIELIDYEKYKDVHFIKKG
jgi:hypothetical protein